MAMASSVYDTGYEDELFQYPVGPSFHCCICTNVIKDPVMCHNEHIFCRACITRHLMNYHTCPTCMQPLTVETLRQAPRGIRNLLSELQIRCEFFDRGCVKFVQLGDLERHVADCGFAPAVCSNEGCQLEVNKHDLLHHETGVCELRRVKCHSCNDIRREMGTVKVSLAAMNETLSTKVENVKVQIKAIEENVVAKVELIEEQLKERNRRLEEDNAEMKKSLNEIVKQLERMTQQTSHGVIAEQMKKGIAEAVGGMEREPKVFIAGGRNEKGALNSVEMFCLTNGTWTPLQEMKERRWGASSVVYNDHVYVSGGYSGMTWLKSIEKLSLNAVHVDQSVAWENVQVELPIKLVGHRSVVFNEQLMVIGGYDGLEYSNSITEISLVPPYTSKLLATMPQRRNFHGVAIFGDKIFIVGGRESSRNNVVLRSVVVYDITKKKCQELAPLPYPVCEMAIVKWGNDNVMIMGGADNKEQPLNKVLMYNIKTQKSHKLPNMKYKRKGCVAAAVKDTVIVMGGTDGIGNYFKSVEGFRFDRNSWKELSPLHEARCLVTAVVC